MTRVREIGAHIAAVPPRNIAEFRDQYDDVTARLGHDAWKAENARWRAWMAQVFDQARLGNVRAEIIERGRAQQ